MNSDIDRIETTVLPQIFLAHTAVWLTRRSSCTRSMRTWAPLFAYSSIKDRDHARLVLATQVSGVARLLLDIIGGVC